MKFHLSNQNILQKPTLDELSKKDIIPDVKYQAITYYMHDRNETVQNDLIDFFKAINKLQILDWTYSRNYIGFTNNNTKENVQFARVGPNKWYAEKLIKHNGKWDGYVWCCYSKFRPIKDMLKLFFEEASWSEILSWKLMRIGKYAKD